MLRNADYILKWGFYASNFKTINSHIRLEPLYESWRNVSDYAITVSNIYLVIKKVTVFAKFYTQLELTKCDYFHILPKMSAF